MQFHTLQAFWEMGGHGPYVWAAFSISALVVTALIIQPMRKRRQILAGIKQRKHFEEQS